MRRVFFPVLIDALDVVEELRGDWIEALNHRELLKNIERILEFSLQRKMISAQMLLCQFQILEMLGLNKNSGTIFIYKTVDPHKKCHAKKSL